MYSLNEINLDKKLYREAFLSILTAMCLLLFVFETMIPKPLPFIKIGLANSVILFLIINKYRFIEILSVSLMKIIIGSVFTGTLLTPLFFLSFSGGLVSTLGMYLYFKFFNRFSGVLSISIFGAVLHLFSQFLVLQVFFFKNFTIISYMYSIAAVSGIITGSAVGFITYKLSKTVKLHSI